jgi:hypothetical protein
MPRTLSLILILFTFVGFLDAQGIAQQKTATVEQKEIVTIERQQLKALLAGGSIAADWFNSMFSDDIAYTGTNGQIFTKARLQEEYRTGKQLTRSAHHKDYRVVAYKSATIVAYTTDDVMERDGKLSSGAAISTDVFVKQNGAWQIVNHQSTPVSW